MVQAMMIRGGVPVTGRSFGRSRGDQRMFNTRGRRLGTFDMSIWRAEKSQNAGKRAYPVAQGRPPLPADPFALCEHDHPVSEASDCDPRQHPVQGH